MVNHYRRPYLDACVFISWIKGEKPPDYRVDRGHIVSHILGQAERGIITIYTSSATLAEVHKRRGYSAIEEQQSERILTYFENQFIMLVDVDRRIGLHANELCRRYELKPFDGIHLASALRANCDVLLTWDGTFIGRASAHGGIQIEQPEIVGQAALPLMILP